jgi:diacylglycerol O-acyltransferase / wax synthase
MTRLSTIDGGFLLTETPHSPKHVGALMIFQLPKGKGSAWLRSLLNEMKQVPPGFPFDQRLKSTASPFFELEPDEQLELDYHVRHTVLPRPGGDRELREAVARIHANLLDRDRPLWEFYLIEGLAGRRFALYVKIHHALADGITFGCWIDDCTSTSARDQRVRPIWARCTKADDTPALELSFGQLITDGIKTLGGGVSTAIGVAAITGKMLQRRIFDRDEHVALPLSAPHTSLNVTTGAARTLAFTSYALQDLRAIGKARGASINDVVMTMCDMALSHYLERHGDIPRGSLVAYMPVNIRTAEEGGEGNLVTLLQVKLASSHIDPLSSLDEVKESIASAREVFSGVSRSAVQYYSLLVALFSLFEEIFKLGRLLPPVNNLVISNVPGSKVKRYLKGAEAVGIYPVSTLPPMTALNVTCCSFAGILYFGLIAGRTAVPDLPLLTHYLDQAFEQLAAATGVSHQHRKTA